MSNGKLMLIASVAVSLLFATQAFAVAGSTGKLRIENNNTTSISLSSSNAGFCGTFIGATGGGAPPATVAGSSFSPVFKLLTSGCSSGINVATFTYTGSSGELVAQCTYKITGNDSFTFSASGTVPGCGVVFDPAGNTDFVFPNLGSAKTRGVKPIRGF